MTLIVCALLAAVELRPTIAIVPPVPRGRAESWIGVVIADNLGSRLLFHSRYDPKTVTRVYPLNVFGWRQSLSAARAEGVDTRVILARAAAERLMEQLGADRVWVGSYSVAGKRVKLSWRLHGDPSQRERSATFDLSNLPGGTDALAADLLTALGQNTKGLSAHRLDALPLAAMKPYGQALEILGRQSLDPRAHLVLGRRVVEQAHLWLTAATDAHGEFVRAWVMRGIASAMLGKMEAAEQELVRAMTSAGEFDPMTSLGLYYLYTRQGEAQRAIDVLEEATKTHLGFLHGLGYLGQAYTRASNNHEALRVFSTYQARVPKNPWVRVKRAEATARIGKHELAITDTEKILADHPRSIMVLTALASRQIDARRLDQARLTIERALELHPNHPALLTRLSYVELEQDQPEAALKLAERAVAKLGDGRGETLAGYAHLNLGHALALLGRKKEALTALTRAKALGVDAEHIIELRRDARLHDFMNDRKNPFRLPTVE